MAGRTNLMCRIAGLCVGAAVGTVSAEGPRTPREEFVSDLEYRFLFVQQGWGKLGTDASAHAGGKQGERLKIGEREFAKGLGHHAPGEIVVDLAGEYSRFESLVGVHPQASEAGSVEFRVFVDDQLKYESGVVRQDTPAREVSVDVSGAQELRLVLTDAGDGITCDLGNWADARLVRAEGLDSVSAGSVLDIAPFGEVVTSDPGRTEGARSTRIQEYLADDIYMETPVAPDVSGVYVVNAAEDGPAAIGLKWMERRRLRSVGFELAERSAPLRAESLRVQCWVGESAWQGGWKPVHGQWSQDGRARMFRLDWSSVPEARGSTRKVRFIADKPITFARFTAFSPTPLAEVGLHVELEKPLGQAHGIIEMYNGELLGRDDALRVEWPQDRPLSLKVRYTQPRRWLMDGTVLRFKLPGAAFGVAVDDVLNSGAVYVRDSGLYITTDPPSKSLAEYKQEIANKKTILEEVRNLPDQTFEQATRFVHHPAQNLQPTLLSLACDNHKIIVHRQGMVQFSTTPEKDHEHVSAWRFAVAGQIAPTFGSGRNEKLARSLDGGWMPIVVNSVQENGIAYRQRTFVAPTDNKPMGTGESVGVAEFTIENTGGSEAEASLQLAIMADAGKGDVAEMMAVPGGAVAFRRGRLLTFIHSAEAKPLNLELSDTGVKLIGSLPPRATSRIVVFIPLAVMKPEQHNQFGNVETLLRATRDHWKAQLAEAMQVDLPDPLLTNVIKASQVHCLIAARNEAEGARIAPWIASVVYGPLESEANSIIRGMDYFGHHDFARKSLDFFIHRYNEAGFLTTGYTIMGTGWHLWMLGEHYRLNGDRQWLESVAPEVSRVCEWIVNQRSKTMRTHPDGSRPPEYGLMPPGVMADWNAFAYYFCLNGYFCTGLAAAADALADVGTTQAADFKAVAAEFKGDILRAFQWTQARMPVYPLRDGTSVPGYPSQVHGPGPTAHFFPGEDGNRSWCYDVELGSHHLIPFGIISVEGRATAAIMDHMEDVQFLSEGWFDFPAERSAKNPFNYGGFAKVQPYYCRNGEINALRDDVKPFVRTYFNSLVSLLNYENLSLQEHFAGVAAWNKTHETGYFLHQTRLMMVMERKGDLWLAPLVTDNWLKDGMSLAATNAPTRFGPVSYRIRSAAGNGYIDATIEPPTRRPPHRLVLRLRHPEGKPMRAVTVNGQPHDDFDPDKEIIRTSARNGKIVVRASY